MEFIKSKKLLIAGFVAALCLACVASFATMSINNADATDSPTPGWTSDPLPIDEHFSCTISTENTDIQEAFEAGLVSFVKVDVPSAVVVPEGQTATAVFLKVDEPVNFSNGSDWTAVLHLIRDNAAEVADHEVTLWVPIKANDIARYDQVLSKFNAAGVADFTVDFQHCPEMGSPEGVYTFVTKITPAGDADNGNKSPKTGLF